jgi:hypothetical protein
MFGNVANCCQFELKIIVFELEYSRRYIGPESGVVDLSCPWKMGKVQLFSLNKSLYVKGKC